MEERERALTWVFYTVQVNLHLILGLGVYHVTGTNANSTRKSEGSNHSG